MGIHKILVKSYKNIENQWKYFETFFEMSSRFKNQIKIFVLNGFLFKMKQTFHDIMFWDKVDANI